MFGINGTGGWRTHLSAAIMLLGMLLVGGVVVYSHFVSWAADHTRYPPLTTQRMAHHVKYPPRVLRQGPGAHALFLLPDTILDLPGDRQPRCYPVAQVDVRAEEEIIGITIAGKHRAYLVRALDSIYRHIVNDLIDNRPVSITYCDQTNCARAFTGGTPGIPLAIRIGGWHNRAPEKRDRVSAGAAPVRGSLVMKVGEQRYFQDTGAPLNPAAASPFPYCEVAVTRTTWGSWKKAHPDTDIYLGSCSNEMLPEGTH